MNTALTESNLPAKAVAEMGEQCSLARILGIWAPAALIGGPLYIFATIREARKTIHDPSGALPSAAS